jgi:Helix-turn-helix domain
VVGIWSSPRMRDDDGRKLDHKTLEQLRIRAVRQIEQGAHPEDVAAALGMPRATVSGWLANYRQGGLAALTARPVPGRPPKLSGAQLQRISTLVVGNDPRQLQFVFAWWTRAMASPGDSASATRLDPASLIRGGDRNAALQAAVLVGSGGDAAEPRAPHRAAPNSAWRLGSPPALTGTRVWLDLGAGQADRTHGRHLAIFGRRLLDVCVKFHAA